MPATAVLKWFTVVPRGDVFMFCVRPSNWLTLREQAIVTEFCNSRFGTENWKFASRTGLVAPVRVDFRFVDDLATFVREIKF